MAVRILVAVVLFAVVAGIALWLERRRRHDAPTQPGARLAAQLDREDFDRPDAPWLDVLFTSKTCDSCAGLYEKAAPLASDEVAVAEVEYSQRRDLHDRYHVDAAPTTLIADAEGVVRASFVGAFGATDLWNAMAELRAE